MGRIGGNWFVVGGLRLGRAGCRVLKPGSAKQPVENEPRLDGIEPAANTQAKIVGLRAAKEHRQESVLGKPGGRRSFPEDSGGVWVAARVEITVPGMVLLRVLHAVLQTVALRGKFRYIGGREQAIPVDGTESLRAA